jgi:hypothetical protein
MMKWKMTIEKVDIPWFSSALSKPGRNLMLLVVAKKIMVNGWNRMLGSISDSSCLFWIQRKS